MKNADNIVTVDKTKHASLRVQSNPDKAHAKEMNLAAVNIAELGQSACNFAVIFIQPPNEKMRPVVMFGLRPGENVYYNHEGWDCTYLPMMIHRHPFVIGWDDREPEGNTLTTCINMQSPLVGESEGIALFKEDGEGTDFLMSRHMLLRDIFEGEKLTEEFTAKLQELDLIKAFEIIVQPEVGEARKITGMYTIDPQKLLNLDAEVLQQLNKKEFLAASYVMMSSLFHIHNLMKLHNRKGFEKIRDYTIDTNPQPQEAPAANT